MDRVAVVICMDASLHANPMSSAKLPRLRGGLRLLALALLLLAANGCTRRHYRLDADRDVDHLVAQKENDPRWTLPGFNVYSNPLSRYYDPYDPDRSPMPPDDPASHEFMIEVDGMKGWRGWDRDGVRPGLQSPFWRERLGEYAPLNESGDVILDVHSSLDLAVINAPAYRSALEEIYLSALDVSTERFRFEAQYYGGIAPIFTQRGPAQVGNAVGSDTFSLTNAGRVQRHLATGGDVLVGFANSFVWQFAGPDTNNTTTILNYNIVQPILRNGGRAVALEQLTIAERAMLANLRAFERYRQGFYTNVAVGNNDTTAPQRRGGFFGGTGLTGFSGQGSGGFGEVGSATGFGRGNLNLGGGAGGNNGSLGFAGGGAGTVGGFIGLVQSQQQIRNTEASLKLMTRALSLLEANLEAGLIDIAQVDQFRQNIESERAVLLQSQIGLENSIETFVRTTIGLPPDLPVDLDDTIVHQFRFIDPETTALQDRIADFIDRVGKGPDQPSIEFLEEHVTRLSKLRDEMGETIRLARGDLAKMDAAIPKRAKTLTPDELTQLKSDRTRLDDTLVELEERYHASEQRIERLREAIAVDKPSDSADDLVAVASGMGSLAQELSLVQVRARLETVTIDPITLDPETALSVARTARLDWMNNRAALVDTWRLITYNARALRSNLTVTFDGDVSTLGNNPTRIRAPTGTMRAGVQFDPPFTRLLERNNYRQVLIDYQRDRRAVVQYEDSVNQGLRQDLRMLRQLALNLEIQRRAVAIAVRRVDQTAEVLNQPPPMAQPGQATTPLGPTAALNLITALSDLRNSQNNFMSVWLNYYAQRMVLMRDLGVMELDDSGQWIDRPLDDVIQNVDEIDPLPPDVPEQWLKDAGLNPNQYEPDDSGIQPGVEPETLPAPRPDAQPVPRTPSTPPLLQPPSLFEPNLDDAQGSAPSPNSRAERQPAYRRTAYDESGRPVAEIACLPTSKGENKPGPAPPSSHPWNVVTEKAKQAVSAILPNR